MEKVKIERVVAGSIYRRPVAAAQLIGLLTGDYFYDKVCRAVFEAGVELATQKASTTPVKLLYDVSQRLGQEFDFIAANSYFPEGDPNEIQYYAGLLRRAYLADHLDSLLTDCKLEISNGTEPLLCWNNLADKVQPLITMQQRGETLLGHWLQEAVKESRKVQQSGKPAGITTGIAGLDSLTGGWIVGDQVLLAGRPGMGKTTFAVNLLLAAARSGKHVLLHSLEMSSMAIAQIFLAVITGIDVQRLRTGAYSDGAYEELQQAAQEYRSLPIRIETGHFELNDLVTNVRTYAATWGVDLLAVDYIQKVHHAGADSTVTSLEMVSGKLKELTEARDVGCANLVLSQFSRDASKLKRPAMLADLKGSGALEQDATMVLALERDNYEQGSAASSLVQLKVLKNRFGDTGLLELEYKHRRYVEAGKLGGSVDGPVDGDEAVPW
jgi:replicative DNA helicase